MNQIQIGLKVRELRTNMGITQDELATRSGLTVRSIQRIEAGKTIPRGDSLKRLASVLNVSVETLIADRFHRNVDSGRTINGESDIAGALILFGFAFLFHPLLGVLLPMLIWVIFRKRVEGMQEIGLKVIRIEALWCVVFACVNAYVLAKKLFHLNVPIPANIKVFAILNVALYLLNALLLAIYFARWFSLRKKEMASLRV